VDGRQRRLPRAEWGHFIEFAVFAWQKARWVSMQCQLMVVAVVSLLASCAGPEARLPQATASVPGADRVVDTSQPATPEPEIVPVPASPLPPGYTLTDTSGWSTIEEDGERAILRHGGVAIDTVDLNFGVAAVGEDSLVFLPVRTDTVPLTTTSVPSYESFPTDHVLWTPTSRRKLSDVLPFFDAYFSSPTIPSMSVIHYWGIAPHKPTNRLYAMRYDFRTARVDSVFLDREDALATDYRYHLGIPQIHGNEVSFDGVVLDSTTWRVIRHDPPPR